MHVVQPSALLEHYYYASGLTCAPTGFANDPTWEVYSSPILRAQEQYGLHPPDASVCSSPSPADNTKIVDSAHITVDVTIERPHSGPSVTSTAPLEESLRNAQIRIDDASIKTEQSGAHGDIANAQAPSLYGELPQVLL